MEESAPLADWHPHESALMQAVHISIAEPEGNPRTRGGRTTIGVVRIMRHRIRVVPHHGLTDLGRRRLRSAGCWAWLHGPRGAHWEYESGVGWISEVTVAQASGCLSASESATARAPSVALPNDQSSSGWAA